MADRYRQGRLIATGGGSDQLPRLGEQVAADYRRAMDGLTLHEGAAAAFRLIDATNEYIAETAPWALAKDPASADRLTQVLFDAAEAIRLAAVLLQPIMPSSSQEILRRVGARATASPSIATAAGATTASARYFRKGRSGRARRRRL